MSTRTHASPQESIALLIRQRAIAILALLVLSLGATSPSWAIPYYPQTVLNHSDLIGYYRLDETSGAIAVEESASIANGTYNGGIPTANEAGPRISDGFAGLDNINSAPSFSDSSVGIPSGAGSPFDLENLTVTTFFKSDTFSVNGGRMLHIGSDSNNGLQVSTFSSSGFYFTTDGAATYQTTEPSVISKATDDQWHHLVVVRNGDNVGDLDAYIDGDLVTLASIGTAFNPETGNRIGNRGDTDPNRDWNGSIDEVAFFSTAFDAMDVANLYSAAVDGAPVPEPSTLSLLCLGLIALVRTRRRRYHEK